VSTTRYIEKVVTLELDIDRCTGCGMCVIVCPHAVFEMVDRRARVSDRGACMECGACARNCSYGALSVSPGVGCADAIIRGWLTGSEPTCGCSSDPVPTEAVAPECGCGDGSCADATPDRFSDKDSRGGSCC
jgi:NAD-dependent dihydropyrimidine dehydrogenase PreA subunit